MADVLRTPNDDRFESSNRSNSESGRIQGGFAPEKSEKGEEVTADTNRNGESRSSTPNHQEQNDATADCPLADGNSSAFNGSAERLPENGTQNSDVADLPESRGQIAEGGAQIVHSAASTASILSSSKNQSSLARARLPPSIRDSFSPETGPKFALDRAAVASNPKENETCEDKPESRPTTPSVENRGEKDKNGGEKDNNGEKNDNNGGEKDSNGREKDDNGGEKDTLRSDTAGPVKSSGPKERDAEREDTLQHLRRECERNDEKV